MKDTIKYGVLNMYTSSPTRQQVTQSTSHLIESDTISVGLYKPCLYAGDTDQDSRRYM